MIDIEVQCLACGEIDTLSAPDDIDWSRLGGARVQKSGPYTGIDLRHAPTEGNG